MYVKITKLLPIFALLSACGSSGAPAPQEDFKPWNSDGLSTEPEKWQAIPEGIAEDYKDFDKLESSPLPIEKPQILIDCHSRRKKGDIVNCVQPI